jgi:hypothetical protein
MGKWVKGQSGNPKGRPPKSRERLKQSIVDEQLQFHSFAKAFCEGKITHRALIKIAENKCTRPIRPTTRREAKNILLRRKYQEEILALQKEVESLLREKLCQQYVRRLLPFLSPIDTQSDSDA